MTNQQTFESYNAVLQSASNRITDQILEYWTQNPDLSVEVTVDRGMPGDAAPFNEGMVARARIFNSLHRVDTPFSERSAGFVWFFSFLVKFAQVQKAGEPVILLLDEPGLTLHGKAQADLMKFFEEKLAPHHQVIYSTHSPFMVPAHTFGHFAPAAWLVRHAEMLDPTKPEVAKTLDTTEKVFKVFNGVPSFSVQ